jgi:phosphopantetheinyl transferase
MLKALAGKRLHIADGLAKATPEAQEKQLEVWTARPADFGDALVQDLDLLLDDSERERAARFKYEADRRAYVLAHALRRSVLARWLAIDPREIRFSQEPGGRPVLPDPGGPLFFSHSRSRDAVACAVTRVAPVGIDVEAAHAAGVDEEMISRFVVPGGDIGLGQDERTARFYFYWTALEAFWKAQGKGLVDGNPRIECRQLAGGSFDVWLERDEGGPRARVFPIRHAPDTWIALAVCSTAEARCQLFNGNKQLFNERSAHEMLSAR